MSNLFFSFVKKKKQKKLREVLNCKSFWNCFLKTLLGHIKVKKSSFSLMKCFCSIKIKFSNKITVYITHICCLKNVNLKIYIKDILFIRIFENNFVSY